MISKDKQYRTRDGREVRIYATDGRYTQEVHGAIKQNNGWMTYHWPIDGWCRTIGDCSLVEAKPRIKRTVWLNIYPDHVKAWLSEHNAALSSYRIACVKVEIDVEEGEGL